MLKLKPSLAKVLLTGYAKFYSDALANVRWHFRANPKKTAPVYSLIWMSCSIVYYNCLRSGFTLLAAFSCYGKLNFQKKRKENTGIRKWEFPFWEAYRCFYSWNFLRWTWQLTSQISVPVSPKYVIVSSKPLSPFDSVSCSSQHKLSVISHLLRCFIVFHG